jgi:hypothetical protein
MKEHRFDNFEDGIPELFSAFSAVVVCELGG